MKGMKGTKERKKGGENMCWKWGMFVRNTYVTHTYKPRCLGISAPALAGSSRLGSRGI